VAAIIIGFLEIIHPVLAFHQIHCSATQISFGVVFEIPEPAENDEPYDIDSDYIPNFDKIVWEKNLDKYDQETLAKLILKSKPHKIKSGDFNQE